MNRNDSSVVDFYRGAQLQKRPQWISNADQRLQIVNLAIHVQK